MKRRPDRPTKRHLPDGLKMDITPDRRLKTTVRWTLEQNTIRVRVPPTIPRDRLDSLLDDIVARVITQRARARRLNDDDLEQRAHNLNRRYFDGELRWHTIRWVSNMAHRLGSCTTGGSTDGDIRISDRIREWPVYVVEYIIAHELAHRKHPNHSPEFWAYLARYPHTERARGFIEGNAYARGEQPDDLL